MKTLVTGATGFLGSWLTRRLLDAGHEVSVLRRASSDLSEIADLKVHHMIGDVTDLESTMNAVNSADVVFHLAGLIGYTRAQRQAMELVNVQGTANVLAACKKHSPRRLIYMSSVVAIGASFDKGVLDENSPYNVSHLNLGYFETKHQAEILVKKAAAAGEVDAVMLNPSTVYGAGDARKGSRKTQLKVAQGRFPFYTSGGVNVVYVEDVVDATIRAVDKGRTGERYILSGENILVKDLFQTIADIAGAKPPRLYLPNSVVLSLGHIGDLLEKFGKKGPISMENAWTAILFHWFDSTKAQKELGLKIRPARFSLEQSVGWMKQKNLI